MKAKSRKIFLAAVSVALIGVMGAAGTFAYLQDSTEDVVNTFETNEVKVTLTETDENGNEVSGRDDYNIIPGTSESKDPKVTVDNTVDSYVYVEVTDETQGLVTWVIDNGWTKLDGYDNVYYREVSEDADTKEFSVLAGDKVSYAASLTNEDMYTTDDDGNTIPKLDVKLTFKASAIQKAPFDDPVLAYKMADPTVVTTPDAFKTVIQSGGAAILEADISIDELLTIPEDKEVVLDLNGKKITSSMTTQERPIVNNGTLVITGNGTIDTTEAGGFGAIRNYGNLTIENGTFKGDGLAGGSAVDTQSGATTVINGGTYYACAAVMNRAGGTVIINDGDFEGVSNANESYSQGNWSYAIRNYGTMTINGGTVHGSMNGGIANDSGTLIINDGYFCVESTGTSAQTFYVVARSDGTVTINGGTFEQKNGTDRLLGGFSGMPSWDVTSDLEANGYYVNGGTFILNGATVTIQ